jgi:hypothetical protein
MGGGASHWEASCLLNPPHAHHILQRRPSTQPGIRQRSSDATPLHLWESRVAVDVRRMCVASCGEASAMHGHMATTSAGCGCQARRPPGTHRTLRGRGMHAMGGGASQWEASQLNI